MCPGTVRAGRHRSLRVGRNTQSGSRLSFASAATPAAQPRSGRLPTATPANQPRSGLLPTATPANHPAGQHRTRCSPQHPRRQAAHAIRCQVKQQPTTVTVSALPSSYDAARSTATGAAGGAVHRSGAPPAPPMAMGQEPPAPRLPPRPLVPAVGVATTPAPPPSPPPAVAAGVSRC
jgi:hypothetical protein